MKKWLLVVISAIFIISVSVAAYYFVLMNNANSNRVVNYTYSVVNTYRHDPNAFTEGLVYDGALYESTGLVGESSLRKVDLKTGAVLQTVSLGDNYFGEGITIYGDNVYQLTWESQKCFVYNKTFFNLTGEFSYAGEGWGLTHDDTRLIMSNGSAVLTFLDPVSFQVVGTLRVHDGDSPVENLNELEYIKGDIYANVWHQDKIAIINVQTGQVKGWINLAGLYQPSDSDPENVLNGIAYDASNNRLFVTGKRWSQLFEITIRPSS
jgi:glutamine cyclotransferase